MISFHDCSASDRYSRELLDTVLINSFLSSDIGTWNTNTGNIPGRLGQVLNFAMSVIHTNGVGPNFQEKISF